ncbi:MAG: sialate O-acetylesterase [Paludibacter sp.]|nr:sialate O-acetylesterase [Paludibacter sp.]
MKLKGLIAGLLFISILSTAQQLTINEIFNNGAVLQQNSKVLIWGTASPGSEVTVEIQGKNFRTKTNTDGKWTDELKALKAGGPFEMTVKSGTSSLKFNEIYVGEVWIAGGQSNMGFRLDKAEGGEKEIANAQNKNIRFVMVPVITYPGQKTPGDMNWRTATTKNMSPMSAVAYFFAKDLQKKLNVPVGIICCYKGGTSAEVWMSRETLLSNPEHAPIVKSYEEYTESLGNDRYEALYKKYLSEYKLYKDSVKSGFENAVRPVEPMGDKNYKRPYVLYDNMFKRIIPYSSKGVIWYQGEANAKRAEQYKTLFPALITEWRSDLQNKNLPFLFVQLADYDHPAYGVKPYWAELREAQLQTWEKVKNTGMAVSIDKGEKNDIHPTYKEPVGKRLAAIAFNRVYDMNVPYSGPLCKNMKIKANKAVLSFDFVYGGLTSDGELKGFTICGDDKKFVPAEAVITGDKIEVSSPLVAHPVAVRYGWVNWTDANLKNTAGFPASPFRTDHFELLTHNVKATNY